jgi:hypothetical protein
MGRLVGALGPDRVPRNWSKLVDSTPEEIEAMLSDDDTSPEHKESIEAHLALAAVAEEIRRENAKAALRSAPRGRRRAGSAPSN